MPLCVLEHLIATKYDVESDTEMKTNLYYSLQKIWNHGKKVSIDINCTNFVFCKIFKNYMSINVLMHLFSYRELSKWQTIESAS